MAWKEAEPRATRVREPPEPEPAPGQAPPLRAGLLRAATASSAPRSPDPPWARCYEPPHTSLSPTSRADHRPRQVKAVGDGRRGVLLDLLMRREGAWGSRWPARSSALSPGRLCSPNRALPTGNLTAPPTRGRSRLGCLRRSPPQEGNALRLLAPTPAECLKPKHTFGCSYTDKINPDQTVASLTGSLTSWVHGAIKIFQTRAASPPVLPRPDARDRQGQTGARGRG